MQGSLTAAANIYAHMQSTPNQSSQNRSRLPNTNPSLLNFDNCSRKFVDMDFMYDNGKDIREELVRLKRTNLTDDVRQRLNGATVNLITNDGQKMTGRQRCLT